MARIRLLFVTQVLDEAHPVLGFTCGWIRALAAECDRLTVVCQAKEEFPPHFAPNVAVHSLGKESGVSRGRQVRHFWRMLLREADNYDAILVHMTPIWVVFAAPLGLVLRKPIYLWYEARGRGWNLRLALFLVKRVFSASAGGMPITTPRSVIVGHGIDTDLFHPAGPRDSDLVITVGRITASKNLPAIINAFAMLPGRARLLIVGAPVTNADTGLLQSIQHRIAHADLAGRVTITAMRHADLPGVLSKARLFLHAAVTSLDKAVLEAMACGVPVVSSSPAVQIVLPDGCRTTESQFAAHCQKAFHLNESDRARLSQQLRQTVIRDHSLATLARRLLVEMETPSIPSR